MDVTRKIAGWGAAVILYMDDDSVFDLRAVGTLVEKHGVVATRLGAGDNRIVLEQPDGDAGKLRDACRELNLY